MKSDVIDYFYMVDWSAASKPKLGADSIWIAGRRFGNPTDQFIKAWNVPTRAQAWAWLEGLAEECAKTGAVAVVGFDFAFAYPVGTAKAIGYPEGAAAYQWEFTWARLAELVEDSDDNRNNRFAVGAMLNQQIATACNEPNGPFWGCVGKADYPGLSRKKPRIACSLPEWRAVERQLIGCQSGWKLAYAGAVGGQTLVGIAGLQRLRQAGLPLKIWPFELDERPIAPGDVVVAETYPSFWPLQVDRFPVKDANQVSQVVENADHESLSSWLQTARIPAEAKVEEGWVLGVPCP